MAENKNSRKKKPESEKKESEKVCEIFEIEKKGRDIKEKTLCGTEEKKQISKEDAKKQEKILRNILIVLAALVLLIFGVVYILHSSNSFTYRGIEGQVVKEGKLLFYSVSFPVNYHGNITSWPVYIRNDPRRLDKIPFGGEMDFGKKFSDNNYRLVINRTDRFPDCDGDEAIAIGNMINLQALGVKIAEGNVSCDPEGRYMYINIKKGEESKITQIGNACYELDVKDCDILKVTERFMVEMFVRYYEQ